MIVADASVAVKWFVPENGFEAALQLLASNEKTIAPDLLISETMHALRKKVRAGDVTEDQYMAAAAELPTFLDELVPSASVAGEAARLSIKLDHGFYDCVYLAVAPTSGAQLVTADDVFSSKARSAGFPSTVRALSQPSHPTDILPALSGRIVEDITRLAERVSETFDALRRAHTRGDRFNVHPVSIYRPAFDSPAYLRSKQTLLALSPEERAQVIALGWFGRDYECGPFEPLVENARRMFADAPAKDLAYIMSVMSTVRTGYEKLRRLGDAQSATE